MMAAENACCRRFRQVSCKNRQDCFARRWGHDPRVAVAVDEPKVCFDAGRAQIIQLRG
jgi:hypothetical protein